MTPGRAGSARSDIDAKIKLARASTWANDEDRPEPIMRIEEERERDPLSPLDGAGAECA